MTFTNEVENLNVIFMNLLFNTVLISFSDYIFYEINKILFINETYIWHVVKQQLK